MVFCLLLFLPLQKSSQQFSNLEEKKKNTKKTQQKCVCVRVCIFPHWRGLSDVYDLAIGK